MNTRMQRILSAAAGAGAAAGITAPHDAAETPPSV